MKLNSKMGEQTKQVRVDNWGIFFLQRLQMFFSKTDYCDMTLQFEGNVQLKVHRLVMNACTEYFQLLEQTCTLEDNVILMPSNLQADVIVPIVNFMYTGMLEFHLSIFEKLYKTAQIMNITILTKLLDAQKQPNTKGIRRKHTDSPIPSHTPAKKPYAKASHSDLPATLPGRKLPIWKRKNVPASSQMLSSSQSHFSDAKWSNATDPLSLHDNAPKPTRFEWPDEDLPTLPLMETSFEEISYTSKPLLTLEEENRASTSFDDVRQMPNASRASSSAKKRNSPSIDMEEVKNYVKEQKIRSGLSQEEESVDNELECVSTDGGKRKAEVKLKSIATKKVRFDEQENKTTTISIATDGKNSADLDHEKIVSEILKKYPQLVKKNKNIRLKIMAKNNKTSALEPSKIENIQIRTPKKSAEQSKPTAKAPTKQAESKEKTPWVCERCSTDDEPLEFVLYYLYRKHMTDVHNEKMDSKLCKYCGHRCNKQNLLMYHLYTKHGMKPPSSYNFPKCDQCPYIALSASILSKHRLRHDKDEIQCVECKLTFTSQTTLTSHMQITGHTGKSSKNNYDCQYCTKKYQSGVNLFSHVRMQHRTEAMRDGIVSVDEVDEIEDYDEEDNSKDEYILPEIISDAETAKKVNILSNVKVQDRMESHSRHQISLEPSSEAEALNNVATGIATSLGLVDIVVLNDNQQLFLQSNQQNFSGDQNDQPEFILPELTGREDFSQNQNEVITTDGVITQSMIASGDIGSTDELVMVLTDHDYGDNQEEITSDNSNIVVLYSHPVDGQQDQFITSQGNIMVNSQTGMIEIRNGATITSTTDQVVMASQDSHVESIEMIQREIEGHSDLKSEPLYDSDDKSRSEDAENATETEQHFKGPIQSDALVETLVQGQQLEFSTSSDDLGPCTSQDPNESNGDNVDMAVEERECSVINEKSNEDLYTEKESMDTSENQDEKDATTEEVNEEQHQEVLENPQFEAKEKVTDQICDEQDQQTEPIALESSELCQNIVDAESSNANEENVEENSSINHAEEETDKETSTVVPDDQEVEEDISLADENTKLQQEEDEDKTEEDEEEKCDKNPEVEEQPEDSREKDVCEDVTMEQEFSQSDTSTSQFLDENSQSSQGSQKKDNDKSVSAKISILDDWEDTDSQQSTPKTEKVVETVNKLMDDWEEEEEDNKDE